MGAILPKHRIEHPSYISTYISHIVVWMDEISETLDDLGLERKELFNNDSLRKNVRHDCDSQNTYDEKLLAAVWMTDASGYSDPAQELKVVFLRDLILAYEMVEDLVVRCAILAKVRRLDHNHTFAQRGG